MFVWYDTYVQVPMSESGGQKLMACPSQSLLNLIMVVIIIAVRCHHHHYFEAGSLAKLESLAKVEQLGIAHLNPILLQL